MDLLPIQPPRRSIGAVVLTGGMLMASAGLGVTVAALLWFVDPAGAIPLESWDDQIPGAGTGTRFKVLSEFSGEAVLDKETQLVWEKSVQSADATWGNARHACINKIVGDRKGWRLPSIPELASLIDLSVASSPKLPPGHPFLNVRSDYWSATTAADFPTFAWFLRFNNGDVLTFTKDSGNLGIWCVRGGMNADAY